MYVSSAGVAFAAATAQREAGEVAHGAGGFVLDGAPLTMELEAALQFVFEGPAMQYAPRPDMTLDEVCAARGVDVRTARVSVDMLLTLQAMRMLMLLFVGVRWAACVVPGAGGLPQRRVGVAHQRGG